MALWGVPTTLQQYQAQRSGQATGAYNPPPSLPFGPGFAEFLDAYNAATAPAPDYGPDVVYLDQGGPPALPQFKPYDPGTDPAFQALLAQLGLKETGLRTAAQEQISRAQGEAAVQRPRIAEQGVEQRRGVNLGFEGRGLFRSGERLRQLALQQRGQLQRLGDVDRSLAGRVAGINENLDAQIRDLALQRATAELTARNTAAGSGYYA